MGFFAGIRRFFEYIANFGVNPDWPPKYIKEARLINQLHAFGIIFTLIPFSLCLVEWNDTYYFSLLYLLYCAFFITLNINGKIEISKISMMILYPLFMTLYMIFFGGDFRGEYIFILFVLHGVLFYDKMKIQLIIV